MTVLIARAISFGTDGMVHCRPHYVALLMTGAPDVCDACLISMRLYICVRSGRRWWTLSYWRQIGVVSCAFTHWRVEIDPFKTS